MKTSEKVLIALVAVFVLASAYLLTQYVLAKTQLREVNKIVKAQQINDKIVFFTQLFIDKVLSGQTEVSFEDRLQLENAVRELNDQEIFDQWQKFVKSENDQQAQEEVAELFTMLLDKITK